DVTDGDELTILVTMTEIPLVSLILYYFSSDLNQTLAHEDILNRLPHIEYRCLSSYTLFHSAQPQPLASVL
ncbi:BTB/POZ domain-containing protein, partial [Toxoplasma gondii TgCatPRC2]